MSLTSPDGGDRSFNVDADVLARSPIGSVADLTTTSAESAEADVPDTCLKKPEEPETASVPHPDINVVSPKGTETSAVVDNAAAGGEAAVEETAAATPPATDEFVNQQGVTFEKGVDEVTGPTPYGLPCVRELFRFLISLINPNGDSGGSGAAGSASSGSGHGSGGGAGGGGSSGLGQGATGYQNESMIQVP